jgi:glycosyltransferase involved in cell wall biosynthesis
MTSHAASTPVADAVEPVVTVVIPHFNMPGPLARCLASIKAQQVDGPVEIIVVDNGSTIGPEAALASHPDVRLICETTPGPGPARNAGIANARAPILAFIDADCRAGTGWLQAAVTAVRAGGNRGLAGGDVRIDVTDFNSLTPVEAYEAVFGYRQRMYIEQQGFSATLNLAMHRDVHRAVGPFAGIGIAEDRDWGQRATALGYVHAFVEPMLVYHPARKDMAELWRKWQRHIAHDWSGHRDSGAPVWRWWLKAGLMPVSVLVDGVKMLTSPRLSGWRNRLRGLGVLARIRMMRAAEMLRVINAAEEDAGMHWQKHKA